MLFCRTNAHLCNLKITLTERAYGTSTLIFTRLLFHVIQVFACSFLQEIFHQSLHTDTHNIRTGKQILDEALEKGYILCNLIKVLTLGAAGSGKTSTKYRLLREEPPVERNSTPLAEASIRAISRALFGKDLTGWIRISPEKFMEMLADALIAGVPMEEQLEALRAGVEQLKKTLSEENLSKESVRKENGHRKKGHKKLHKKNPPTASASSQQSPSSQQILRLVERSSGSKKFFEIQWINFIDSGGQPQFHELLPAFIRNTTVTMFVLKLSERLDQQPMIEYYEEGKRCGDALPCWLRNDQILQRCIQMIHSHPSSEGILSQMLFVATHRDLEADCSESRADKNKKLIEMFRPHFRDQLVYYHPFDELIFPINAKAPTEEDRKVASMICEQISRFASKPYKIPVGWFLLEQDIRMLADKGVISLQRCHDIANKLKINADDVVPALNYLDELNILLYYPSLLPGVIFAEPQALLNKLTELVAYSYKLRCGQINEPLTGEWIRFQDEGVVTFQMLEDERFSSHYIPGLFTSTHLVELFKGLLIFASLAANQYFMPSLLPVIPAESISRPSSTITPLLVHFPSKCAQNGVFCALVVHLLTICKWELQIKDGNQACISRNCIQFKLPEKPATITLIDSFSFFEVHLNTPSQIIPSEVRKAVFDGLENAYSKLKYNNSKPRGGYFCKCGLSTPHVATQYTEGEKHYLVCTETSNDCGTLSEEHEVWFRGPSSSSTSGMCENITMWCVLWDLPQPAVYTLNCGNHLEFYN